jgi:hypothetical protein
MLYFVPLSKYGDLKNNPHHNNVAITVGHFFFPPKHSLIGYVSSHWLFLFFQKKKETLKQMYQQKGNKIFNQLKASA